VRQADLGLGDDPSAVSGTSLRRTKEHCVSVQDWGAVGEILGAIAILVTLVYLATQVRYARHTITDANRTSRVEGIRELNGLLVANAEVRAAWNKGMGPGYRRVHDDIAESLGLSFDEASIVITQGASWGFTHWAQYRSMKSPEDEKELANSVKAWYGEDPMRALIMHPNFRGYFDDDFLVFVDETVGLPTRNSPKQE